MVKTACVVCGRKDMLHRFPNNLKRCTKWLEQCNRLDLLEKGVKCLHQNYRLCRRHFKSWCFTSNVSKCLIRCAHPEIFNLPPVKSCELPDTDSDNMITESITSYKDTDHGTACDDEVGILEEVVVPVSKHIKNQESHLVIYNNGKGLPLTKSENGGLYTVLKKDQIRSQQKGKYSLINGNPKAKIKIEINASIGNNLMSGLQKTRSIFSKFNQKKYSLSNSEMARLCLLLVHCKKMSNSVGSFNPDFEELVNGLIYSFQDKLNNKEDQSRFDKLVCDLLES